MVSLSDVRAHNATLKQLPSGLVAVFVGGTSGIGLFTAREFVRNTTSPHVYLVGRNASEATKIIAELRAINSSSTIDFIQKDVSLLRNVDEVCAEIKAKERHINLLFMTCGYFVFRGREETTEGLDRKFALHYYTRMRFAQQLTPLLAVASASQPGALSRVVAVLDPHPGLANTPNWTDLSLKTHFGLKACAVHASAMTNLFQSRLATQFPNTSFVHAYPSGVETNGGREAFGPFAFLGKALFKLAKVLTVPQQESGERHLFAATAPRFAPRAVAASVSDAAVGGDLVRGSGSYFVSWDGEIVPDKPQGKAMREEGKEEVVWQHTEEVFKKICKEGGKY
ncbi:hypothetical protein IQ07DRAFT_11045 [Pyrenochaeta sp. DS3sAY3a]|nr:hypothetical protein IQ07DRAFT_11045 [Pyrenochaeta sp. DS3sAY3a]